MSGTNSPPPSDSESSQPSNNNMTANETGMPNNSMMAEWYCKNFEQLVMNNSQFCTEASSTSHSPSENWFAHQQSLANPTAAMNTQSWQLSKSQTPSSPNSPYLGDCTGTSVSELFLWPSGGGQASFPSSCPNQPPSALGFSAVAAATGFFGMMPGFGHCLAPGAMNAPSVSMGRRRNERERERVRCVNDGYSRLRMMIPQFRHKSKRVSKVETLKAAIVYIRKLKGILAVDELNTTKNDQSLTTSSPTSASCSKPKKQKLTHS